MSGPTPRYPRPRPRRPRLVPWALALLLLVFGVLLGRHFATPPLPPPPVDDVPRQLRTVTLYFAADDALALAGEGRELAECFEESSCLRATLQALLDGPVGDLAPVLPAQATLHGVTVSDGEAQADFSRGLIDGHPGGSSAELLSAYALVNTVAVNFPHLRQLRILVDGQPIETLKGHVDLRQPLVPDFSLIRAAASAGPAAPLLGSPR